MKFKDFLYILLSYAVVIFGVVNIYYCHNSSSILIGLLGVFLVPTVNLILYFDALKHNEVLDNYLNDYRRK